MARNRTPQELERELTEAPEELRIAPDGTIEADPPPDGQALAPRPAPRLKNEEFAAPAERDEESIEITHSAFAGIESEVVAHAGSETGGIVVGQIGKRGVIITQFMAAGANSTRGRAHFERAAADLQTRLDQAVARGEQYLGEWHSHPPGCERPSRTDCDTMLGIVADPGYAAPEVLLVIAVPRRSKREGGNRAHISLRIFYFEHGASDYEEIGWATSADNASTPPAEGAAPARAAETVGE